MEKVEQPVKIQESKTAHGNTYANSCLLEFVYFKTSYKLIIIDLS